MISLQELEHSAAVMMASPSLVTQEQRHSAEQVFLNFRRSKTPYAACKEILEQGKNDYVLFQAASTIKEAILREWTMLNKKDIESLRSFLLTFVTHKQGVQKYVKEQVLQVVAVICKRGILENSQAVRDLLLRDVTQLTTGNNRDLQVLGCSILKSLLNEFSFVNRSSDIGLTWEFHIRCKRAFEVQALKQVFMLVVQALQQFSEAEFSSLPREDVSALARFLSLAEQVLSWDFSLYYRGQRRPQSLETMPASLFKPDSSWRGLVSDPAFLGLFFKLQIKLQANDELCHHCCQCLIQLASLMGGVFPDTPSQTQYLSNFVQGYLQLSKSLEMSGQTALGLGTIVNRLLFVFPCSAFKDLHNDTLKLFVNAMTDLTCSFLQAVAKDEELHSEDTSYIEAVEHFLEGWAILLEHSGQFTPGLFNDSATRIFNCYVQCHLAAPEGLRGTFSSQVNDSIHLDEICDLDSDDRELFSDQLSTIGSFGRVVLGHAMGLLTKLLESRVDQFEKHLCTVKDSVGSFHSGFPSLDNLYEDLHWLILISGYLLAHESDGETPLIPREIISYSSSLKGQIDIQASFDALCLSQNRTLRASKRASDHSRVDPVVQLVSAIFHLADLEKLALGSGLSELLSPQVGRTLVWCLRHWARSYLLPDEKEYEQLSVSLLSLFGMGTDGGKWTVGFLLEKARTNLSGWSAEFQIVEDTAMLLLSLVDTKNRATVAISFEGLWLLAQEHMSRTALLHELPPEVLRYLTQALVLAGSAAEDTTVRQKYLDQLLQALQSHFMSICHQPDFAKSSQKEPTKTQVQCLLESFRGVALASNLRNSASLFTYLLPVLRDCVALLNVYQNCPEVVVLVLEFYVDLVDSQIAFMGENETPKLYEVCMALVQTYGKCNLGKFGDEALTEEEQLNDLVLLMKLLTNLLSKEFLDFGEEKQVSAADVALYGLHVIIPLMSSEVLKFPMLCIEFFKLTTYVCEMYPEKMSALPEALFKNLMTSLEVGLNNYGPDVTKMSLEALSSLASHCYIEIQKNITAPVHEVLRHFLKTLFDMLLLHSFDMDLIQPAAEAFLALICCHQMYYTELVRSLLAQQTDRVVCQRLLEAFNRLTPSDMTLSLDRLNKVQFRKSLDVFLGSVKCFLCVK